MSNKKRIFRLNEELLIRYLYELMHTQSTLYNSPNSVSIELPSKNIYYKSENWEGNFNIIRHLIRDTATSPILVDNDRREIFPVFSGESIESRLIDLSMAKFKATLPYNLLEDITYFRELLKLKIVVEYENNDYVDTGRIECYYKIVNVVLLKNASIIIDNKPALVVKKMTGGFYKIKFNDTKKTKKVLFSNIKLDPDNIDPYSILLKLKLVDIIKSYMRYTPVTFTTSDVIINNNKINIKNNSNNVLEGVIIENYLNGMFRILSNNEFYTIHINNIQDWGEWDIYRLDNKGNIHIDIDNDELLELWEIKKEQR